MAIVVAPATVQSRAEWEVALDAIWEEALAELRGHEGFKGVVALWNDSEPGRATVLALWDTVKNRLAYEADSEKTRQIFEPLYAGPAQRTRYIVSKVALG